MHCEQWFSLPGDPLLWCCQLPSPPAFSTDLFWMTWNWKCYSLRNYIFIDEVDRWSVIWSCCHWWLAIAMGQTFGGWRWEHQKWGQVTRKSWLFPWTGIEPSWWLIERWQWDRREGWRRWRGPRTGLWGRSQWPGARERQAAEEGPENREVVATKIMMKEKLKIWQGFV